MYAILACSIVSLALAVERLIYYRQHRLIPDELLKKISLAPEQCGDILRKDTTSLGEMGAILLSDEGEDPELIEENLLRKGTEIRDGLERNLHILALIGRITPLMGLLGTVMGMITVFKAIEQTGGSASGAQLAGGIWEALLTTAFGLIVAIPTLAVQSLFEKGLDSRMEKLEAFITELKNITARVTRV